MLSYSAAHHRLGRADEHECATCGRQAKQWSYQGSNNPLFSPQGYAYSSDASDYLPMCVSCHKKQDIAAHPERFGHLTSCLTGGPEAMRKRFLTDPEFAERRIAHLNTVRGEAVVALRERRTDPEFSAHMKEVANRRRRCLDCGMVSTAGAMGRHFKASGHTGFEGVS